MDPVTVKFAGAALNDAPDGVGVDVEQFTAQHNRVASAIGDCSLLLARLQHSIMPSLRSCNGVPTITPAASEKRINSIVSRFAINLTIFAP
ncbi:hypothetical protein BH10ACI2_BH10ACI2_21880 [soil metagenome]